MPGASIIDDLGEKQSQVKMSLVALRNSVCNCEPQSVALASKLKKKKRRHSVLSCQIFFV